VNVGGGRSAFYRLTGEVAPVRKSDLAFRVGGFVDKIVARPGGACKQGEVLAQLDTRDFLLRVEIARARLAQAQIGFKTATKELEREKELKAENASTAAAFERVEATFDQARLAQALAQSEMKSAEQALGDTKLIAPYDCVVTEQVKYDGESVQSGTTVFKIYDVKDAEFLFEAPERLLGQLPVGAKIKASVPSSGFSGVATITRVVPVISERTRTFRVYAQPDGAPVLTPGAYAEALLN
jgi:RND family efflux transporter MFP subunit